MIKCESILQIGCQCNSNATVQLVYELDKSQRVHYFCQIHADEKYESDYNWLDTDDLS